jgi:glycosyltransferase involved in cell wall biosynthesis
LGSKEVLAMKKLKIAYVRTQFSFNLKAGGSVGHTLGVLKGFKRCNCEVKIISNEKFLGIEDFDYIIIPPKIKGPTRLWELLYNCYAKDKYKKNILEFSPDFIYHRYTAYTFFIAKIAKELNIPLILELNSLTTWSLKHWGISRNSFKRFIQTHILYNIVKRIEPYNLMNASLIVVVSEALKADLLELGIPEEKILVNPNGVDPEKFNPKVITSEECRILKRELRIDDKRVVVGFSGTFGVWHGIPQLTEAIDKILKNSLSINIYFLLIGDGDLRQESEDQVGHYENVTFMGVVKYSDIQKYLAICDVLVSPQNPKMDGREFFGSPTKLFEYMAMEKGIVASDLGQIGKVLRHNYSVLLIEPGNVDQLVEGILKLAKDKELRETLGKQAREDVVANYTWKKNVENVIIKVDGLIKDKI